MDDSRVSKTNLPRDRLSELPDSLTLEILSLLEMKDAVSTTILSKRWRDLWTTVPCLDFRAANRSFIDGALAKWKGTKILRFSIAFEDVSALAIDDIFDIIDIIGSWLPVRIQKQVEEIYLDFGFYPPNTRNDYQRFKAYVQWNQLRSVNIGGARYVSENDMNELLSGAPGLEELVLNLFNRCEKLKIRSTSLKMLHIGKLDFGDIELVLNPVQMIEAPNLLTLEITPTFYYKDEDCLLDVPSLSKAILHFRGSDGYSDLQHFRHVFQSICHVEKVTLSAFCMEFLVYLKMKDMVVRFSNAKFLDLVACGEARKVLHALEMFPNLMTLKVTLHQGQDLERSSVGEDIDEVLIQMTWPSPSLLRLKTIELTFLGYETPIFPLIEILLENAHMLEKMVVRLGRGFTNPEIYSMVEEKVLGMPRSSPTAVVMINKA